MLIISFIVLVWISSSSALGSGEILSDDQVVASPIIQQLVDRLGVLESQSRNQQQQIHQLQAEVKAQKEEILHLRSVNIKDHQSLGLAQEIPKDDHEGRHVVKSKSDSASRIRKAIENEAAVAFFAGLSTSVQHAAERQIIVFDNVEINAGNGYNAQNGMFSAPVAGIYVFTTSIMTNSGRKICEMVVNGAWKASVYTHGDGHYDHGTQTMIVKLKQSDNVAIQILEHNNDNTIHGEVPPYTTFSGFLLQEDYSDPVTVVG